MSDIKVLKLISGEEIIYKEVKYDDYSITAKDPALVLMHQTNGGFGIGLAPFMPYSDKELLITRSAISVETTPSTEMINEYNRIFGSGLQIADASSIKKLR